MGRIAAIACLRGKNFPRASFVEARGKKFMTWEAVDWFRSAEGSPAAADSDSKLAAVVSPEWSACFLAAPPRALSSSVVFGLAEAGHQLVAIAYLQEQPAPFPSRLRKARCSTAWIGPGHSPCLTLRLLRPSQLRMILLLRSFHFRYAGRRLRCR